MLVGEQPGDQEDIRGRPFVGPAGLLLDRALAEAGIDRGRVYVTNAVKHFKFEPRGKRRLHKRPTASETKICRRWLLDEIEAIGPRLIIALGATAAQGLAGRVIPIQSNRGAVLDLANGLRVLVTIHPSALLRLQGEEDKRSGYASFVNDLRSIERLAKSPCKAQPRVRAAGQRFALLNPVPV
jgi:uracil-DNA glycosylase family protein